MIKDVEATYLMPRESSPPGALSALGHPDDVLNDASMTREQKRAALAFWLSDSHAVQDAPALRRLENGATADVDDLLEALRSLDGDGDRSKRSEKGLFMQLPVTRRQVNRLTKRLRPTAWRVSRDEDDDPPPRPALATYPVKLHSVEATGVRMPQAA